MEAGSVRLHPIGGGEWAVALANQGTHSYHMVGGPQLVGRGFLSLIEYS